MAAAVPGYTGTAAAKPVARRHLRLCARRSVTEERPRRYGGLSVPRYAVTNVPGLAYRLS